MLTGQAGAGVGLGALVALVLAACTHGGASLAQTPPEPAAIAAGRTLVERDCSTCHAVGPEGDSPLAQAPHFRDLHQRFDVEGLAEAFAEGIVVGHGPMPNWRYEPDDVQALIAYLKSLETPPAGR